MLKNIMELEQHCIDMGWRLELTFEARYNRTEKPWAARARKAKYTGWYKRLNRRNPIVPPSSTYLAPTLEVWGETPEKALQNLLNKLNEVWREE